MIFRKIIMDKIRYYMQTPIHIIVFTWQEDCWSSGGNLYLATTLDKLQELVYDEIGNADEEDDLSKMGPAVKQNWTNLIKNGYLGVCGEDYTTLISEEESAPGTCTYTYYTTRLRLDNKKKDNNYVYIGLHHDSETWPCKVITVATSWSECRRKLLAYGKSLNMPDYDQMENEIYENCDLNIYGGDNHYSEKNGDFYLEIRRIE